MENTEALSLRSFTAEEPDDTDTAEREENRRQISENGSVITRSGKHTVQCLTVIGQIEGHYLAPSQTKTTKYEHVIPQIVAVEEDPQIEGLLMILNTVGGDVGAGSYLLQYILVGIIIKIIMISAYIEKTVSF